jgi:predicted RNase H-like HicB family nuclease
MYKVVSGGVHGEVLDFPGVITSGRDIDEARELLGGALVDMAETNLLIGDSLPIPDPDATTDEGDLVEPIHLILNASSRYAVVPEPMYEAA